MRWAIVVDGLGICQSVCLSVTLVGYAKAAEQIDLLFGVEAPGDPRNVVLDGVCILSR